MLRDSWLLLLAVLACGCGTASDASEALNPEDGGQETSAWTDARADASDAGPRPDAADAKPEAADASLDGAVEADALDVGLDEESSGPGCPESPCAARPIIFVHGFEGSNDDFVPMMKALAADDPRYDDYVLSGNEDHAAWPTGGIGRRSWLFAFDYYNLKKEDARGAYTAGPGRIGSNRAVKCAEPMGQGWIVGTPAAYDEGITHEYATDLASMVDDVLRATGASQVDFVAHSMGGMVVRSTLANAGVAAKTGRVLLLASPVRGVPLASAAYIIGVGEPWMKNHETAELDADFLVSAVHFVRCGEQPLSEGSFGGELLERELEYPGLPPFYVMSGANDLGISYNTADHPLEQSHEVVPGVDHSGILKSPEAQAKIEQFLGGQY